MQFESFHWLKPSWAMSHYTMLYEYMYGKQVRVIFFDTFLLFLSLVCSIFGAFF